MPASLDDDPWQTELRAAMSGNKSGKAFDGKGAAGSSSTEGRCMGGRVWAPGRVRRNALDESVAYLGEADGAGGASAWVTLQSVAGADSAIMADWRELFEASFVPREERPSADELLQLKLFR